MVMLVMLVTSLAFVDRYNFIYMLTMFVLSVGDVISDMQYIIFNSFYNLPLTGLCMMYSTHSYSFICSTGLINSTFDRFVILPLLCFANLVFRDKKALPKPGGYDFIWLQLVRHRPSFQGDPFSWSWDSTWGITAICANYVVFLVLIPIQCVYALLAVVFAVTWFIFGYFLYICKMLSLGKAKTTTYSFTLSLILHRLLYLGQVNDFWFYVWTGSRQYDAVYSIDRSLINQSLFHEFCFEATPQVVTYLLAY